MDGAWVAGIFGLVGVALGGLIGPVGSWFLEERKERADKNKKRAEKLEELVAALYEHKHWIDALRAARVFGSGVEPAIVPPFAKVEAISSVYFPKFVPKLAELDLAADEYEVWMMQAQEKRLDTGRADAAGHAEVHRPYFKCLREALTEIRDYAKSEFQ